MKTTTTRQSVPCSCCNGTGRVEIVSGKALRHRREAADMSLRAVAEKVGISAMYLSELEREKKPVSLAMLDRIEAVIGKENKVPKLRETPLPFRQKKKAGPRDAMCPVCEKIVRIGIPAGGDGSADVYFTHKDARGSRCPGSRKIVESV